MGSNALNLLRRFNEPGAFLEGFQLELNTIDKGQDFDFGKTSAAYAAYRDIYPKDMYDKLRALGVAADGSSWLDLGTGTGVLPKNLYNPKSQIIGADISAEQIAFAKAEAAANGWNIHYMVSPAESTGLPDHSFNMITAAQCFFYFDRDKMQKEIPRLLKTGGTFIKIFMDFDTNAPVAKESVSLIKQMNPAWNSSEAAMRDMADALFLDIRTDVFHYDIPFSRESWHGRLRACRGTLASMDENTFAAWEKRHLALLRQFPPQFTVRHTVYLSVYSF